MSAKDAKRDQALFIVPKLPLDLDVRAFITDCQARGLSQNTIRIYQTNLRTFQQWLDVKDIRNVTADHIRRFLVYLQERGRNAGGVHQAYRVLKTFFRWLVAEGEIAQSPVARVGAPKLSTAPLEPVSMADLKAMLATCGKDFVGVRDRAILLCLLDTGCRASEFLALDLGDVNLATGAVIIRHGKGGKFRTCFLGSKARRELVRYLRYRVEPSGPLWVTVDGKRLTYAGLRQIVRCRAQKAGVRAPSLHSFRRAFCLAMLRNGADVVSLSRLMGHADVSLIARYAKQIADDLRAVHDKHGPVDRLLAWLAMLGAALWPAVRLLAQRG